MKLIADSGSTKTDWCLFDNEEKVKSRFASQGINPFHMSEDIILGILRNELLPQLGAAGSSIEKIEFYGAGSRDEILAFRSVSFCKKCRCGK